MCIKRNTVNLWYNRFRESIIRVNIITSRELEDGEFEVDESYF